MVKINPFITIFAGIVVTLTVAYLGMFFDVVILSYVSALFIGGFISTFFAKEPKIRFGIYEGLCVSIIFILLLLMPMRNDTGVIYSDYLFVFGGAAILISLSAGIGGYIGKIAKNHFEKPKR